MDQLRLVHACSTNYTNRVRREGNSADLASLASLASLWKLESADAAGLRDLAILVRMNTARCEMRKNAGKPARKRKDSGASSLERAEQPGPISLGPATESLVVLASFLPCYLCVVTVSSPGISPLRPYMTAAEH